MKSLLFALFCILMNPAALMAGGLFPEPGDAIISEVMANPLIGPEWIEIRNLSDNELSLSGCVLSDGGTSDHSCLIDTARRLQPDGFFIISKGDFPGNSGVTKNFACKGIVLANSGLEEVRLECPSNDGKRELLPETSQIKEIDSVHFDFDKQGFSKGHSIFFCPFGQIKFALQSGAVFMESYGEKEGGTPGWDECEMLTDLRRPSAGEVIFTEIMIAPEAGNGEWFEIYNLTGDEMFLANCRFSEGKFSKEFYFLGNDVKIEPHSYALFSNGRCLKPDGCAENEFIYEKISFGNEAPGEIMLLCHANDGNEIEIDRISYNIVENKKARKKYSLELCAASFDAASNDSMEQWQYAGEADVYHSYSPAAHFGTPGKKNGCVLPPTPVEQVESQETVENESLSNRGFICSFSEFADSGALISALALLALLLGIRIVAKKG
ncbi:MAG: lamin tail domain-containing protein [Deltaproteobacteria bacterium]|nr:lamin tail domain-containing protein [Deltaproteobacteria bacterium]